MNLSAKQQISNLSESKENNEEHNSKASQILLSLRHGLCQLCHSLIEAYILEELQKQVKTYTIAR